MTGEDQLPGMPALKGLVRSVRTPEFAGVTFHEVRALPPVLLHERSHFDFRMFGSYLVYP